MTSLIAHTPVTALSERPERWFVFIHGILGKRANWRSLAKRFVAARPQWGALLVDLRKHGDSQDFSAPHTLEACANDIHALIQQMDAPVTGMLGHSFGGKVALRYLQDYGCERAQAPHDRRLQHLWLIDSMPGVVSRPPARAQEGEDSAWNVVQLLKEMPKHYAQRQDFIDHALKQGLAQSVSTWLAMNLQRVDEGFHFALDLEAIEEMLKDYAATDMWAVVEHPPAPCQVQLIIGGRSHTFSPADRERALQAAKDNDNLSVDIYDNASHWVHVDEAERLLKQLVERSI